MSKSLLVAQWNFYEHPASKVQIYFPRNLQRYWNFLHQSTAQESLYNLSWTSPVHCPSVLHRVWTAKIQPQDNCKWLVYSLLIPHSFQNFSLISLSEESWLRLFQESHRAMFGACYCSFCILWSFFSFWKISWLVMLSHAPCILSHPH